jgi:2,4-diketo-3-deoxy-L-fuconate hydrolase
LRLARYGPPGSERPALVDADGGLRDLSAVIDDLAGDALSPQSLERLAALDPASLPLVDGGTRLGPCVGAVGKFLCIGLNYSDHAAETGATVPPEPVLFAKATSAISGPNDDVVLPRGSAKSDWEVELGIIIGSADRSLAGHQGRGARPVLARHVAGGQRPPLSGRIDRDHGVPPGLPHKLHQPVHEPAAG